MDEVRKADRDVKLRQVPDAGQKRRARAVNDPEYFCRTYFPGTFYHPFTSDQRQIMAAIVDRCRQGGYQAIAATRGEGKTTITRVVGGIWAIVHGHVHWLNIVGANASEAISALEDIKGYYEFCEALGEDYPEVCDPIIALEGAAQRANAQTVEGHRSRLKWGKNEVIFAEAPGSAAAGAMITVRGIDSAIRGLVRQGRRPDLNIVDDPETRESARSATETAARRETLTKDILGLAGPGERMAVAYLCTVLASGCLADEFTDRKQAPAWNGLRHKFLQSEPTHLDLWQKYIELRQTDQLAGDRFGRTAHQFYLENRREMDLGAVINNRHRYLATPLEEHAGLAKIRPRHRQEVSAIQHAYNIICDRGQDHFDSEYQNEPKKEVKETSGLEVAMVQKKLAGSPRGLIPAGTQGITAHIDIHGRALYWAVVAWLPGRRGIVIDYGTDPVHSPIAGKLTSEENLEQTSRAIFSALATWRDAEAESGWPEADGGPNRHLDLCLIDTGWLPEPVALFLKASGGRIYQGAKGYGSGHRQKFSRPDSIPGRHGTANWWRKRGRDGLWLAHINADHYKEATHQGYLTPGNLPGSLALFGDDPLVHRTYAEHILAEVRVREFQIGRGWKEGFQARSQHNHWLDCTSNAVAAADILGLGVLQSPAMPNKKVKLSDLQRAKREGH